VRLSAVEKQKERQKVLLDNKFILLDTNLLISLSKYKTRFTRSFLYPLTRKKCKFYIIDGVYFEFLRNTRTFDEYKQLKQFADRYSKIYSNEEDIENAIRLSILYLNKNPSCKSQVSYIDLLLAAQLIRRENKNKVILATCNLNDFPVCIFDRIKLQVVDLEDKVLTIAYIAFNEAKYKKCRDDFLKTAKN